MVTEQARNIAVNRSSAQKHQQAHISPLLTDCLKVDPVPVQVNSALFQVDLVPVGVDLGTDQEENALQNRTYPDMCIDPAHLQVEPDSAAFRVDPALIKVDLVPADSDMTPKQVYLVPNTGTSHHMLDHWQQVFVCNQ